MTSKRSDAELLELRRKVCEALRWSVVQRHDDVAAANDTWICVDADENKVGMHEWVNPEQAWPHLESDNGLALDALVKFCKENGVRNAELNIRGKDGECCVEFRDGNSVEPHVQVFGETPALAICKALIAASTKGKEGKSDETR